MSDQQPPEMTPEQAEQVAKFMAALQDASTARWMTQMPPQLVIAEGEIALKWAQEMYECGWRIEKTEEASPRGKEIIAEVERLKEMEKNGEAQRVAMTTGQPLPGNPQQINVDIEQLKEDPEVQRLAQAGYL